MPKFVTTLYDCDGQFSSKRVAAFATLACVVVGFVAALIECWPSVPPEFLFTDLMVITLGGLGLAATERFAPQKGKPDA